MAGIWSDPLLPVIPVPSDIRTRWFTLGSAKFQLLPKQYEFLASQEEFLGYIGGVGSGKSKIGCIKSAYLSMTPGNRGIVGMFAGTDLRTTTERDLLDFLKEAELLKAPPTDRGTSDKPGRTALVHCIDIQTGRSLGEHAEIEFIHMDDPQHVRSRKLGWGWIDEASKVRQAAWVEMIGRLRLPVFAGKYKAIETGNPEGHNHVYDFFFNEELLTKKTCGDPLCTLGAVECNRQHIRLKRRGIHCTSYENYFLPPDYVANMLASYSEDQRLRLIEASFDVFEGQIFKEFRHDLHCVRAPESWIDGRPPKEWHRLLAIDVGGSTPWCWLWSAVDTDGNIIFYDELYQTTSSAEELVIKARPKMRDEDGKDYTFRSKIIDYENKIAAEDLRRMGIQMNNAQKRDKIASINRFQEYLHPNPRHKFPNWHPRAGQPGSPRAFIVGCPNFVRELPQQRWKAVPMEDGEFKDEADRSIPNHATDCALYTSRELPRATELPADFWAGLETRPTSKMSEMYWADVLAQREKVKTAGRRPYRAMR